MPPTTLSSKGAERFVNGLVLDVNVPPTCFSFGIERAVNAVILSVKLLNTVSNSGKLTVDNDNRVVGAKEPLMIFNFGAAKVVIAIDAGEKSPFTVLSSGMLKDVSAVIVVGKLKSPPTTFKAGRDRVVTPGIEGENVPSTPSRSVNVNDVSLTNGIVGVGIAITVSL